MSHNRTVKDVLCDGKLFLKQKNVDSYIIDAEVLLMFATGFSKVQLFSKDDYILNDKEFEIYQKALLERGDMKPVQYIVGKCEFMGLDFYVNEHTLIPRGDTEILVEKAIEAINKNGYTKVMDIGTGSGAIAVSIACYCKNTDVVAVDISKEALKKAKENAENNNVAERVNFLESDIFENIPNELYDVIVSNPPYIKKNVIETLLSQVKDFEPHSALDGGEDGLDFYRKIVKNSTVYLKKGGMLLFEIGYNQGKDVFDIMMEKDFCDVGILKDLAGLDRVVFGSKL